MEHTVKASGIGDETECVSQVILDELLAGADGRDDDDTALLSLELFYASHFHAICEGSQRLTHLLAVSVVGRDDTDIVIRCERLSVLLNGTR